MLNIRRDLNPQYITDSKGGKISVILSIDEFKELLEELEDLAAIAERKDDPLIPHEKVKEELKNSGLL
jgi:predicted lipid carrier protein YhbT